MGIGGGGDLGEKDWEGRRGARGSGNISKEEGAGGGCGFQNL